MTSEMTIALGVAGALQLLLMVQLWRTTRAASRGGRRIEQLTSALELLTDTTESGFVNVASELTRVGARPVATASTRRATSRRIAEAVQDGQSLAEVAAIEGLSESEVRLHLGLGAAARDGATTPALVPAGRDEGVLDDLERWMSTLAQDRRPVGGARHAAVRI